MNYSTLLNQTAAIQTGGIFSEGVPTGALPFTLQGWQSLLLLIVLVTVVVLALYWNTRTYEPPEVSSSHTSEHGEVPGH